MKKQILIFLTACVLLIIMIPVLAVRADLIAEPSDNIAFYIIPIVIILIIILTVITIILIRAFRKKSNKKDK